MTLGSLLVELCTTQVENCKFVKGNVFDLKK
jgi:hypothetical protein